MSCAGRDDDEELGFLAATLSAIHVGVYVWQLDDPADPVDMRLVYANPASEVVTGLAVEAVLGKTMHAAFPNTPDGTVIAFAEVARGGAGRALADVVHGDLGVAKRTFSRDIFPLPGGRVGVAFTDISSERAAEARALNTLESMIDACYTLDRDWKFTFINARGEQFAQRRRDQLLGSSIWGTFPEAVHSPLYVELHRAEREGVAVEFEMYYPPFAKWFALKAHPTADGLAVYVQDITSRKELEERVLRSQKLEAVGELVRGVAHDFNNLLNVIDGYASLAQSELGPASSSIGAALEEIRKASAGAAALTTRMLAFSNPRTDGICLTDVNSVVLSAIERIKALVGARICVHRHLDPGTGSAVIDPASVEQAIIDLALNARDAMPGGGSMDIETRSVGAIEIDGPGPVPFVAITVRDHGRGMDGATLQRAFDPFFTTKPVGEGTGLGLSTAYSTVTHAGGRIDVASILGEGSAFTIYLPRAATSALVPKPAAPTGVHGRERILVVEDNDPLRALILRTLAQKGYDLAEAGSSADALALIADRRFDLLITDNVFPGGTGTELARHAVARYPGTPIIFMSGNPVPDHDLAIEGSTTAYFQKPFDLDDLVHHVREIIDVSGGSGSSG